MENKRKLLQDDGFTEMPERRMWINPNRRLAFSEDCVSHQDEPWLTARAAEIPPDTEFWFHFRYLPDDPIRGCREILARLQLTMLTPVLRSGLRRLGQPRPN
jgi:hypothetical protein